MSFYLAAALVAATVVAMEGLAWLVHKYLLHGPLWFLHQTHHQPRKGWWEANDWVAVAYAALSAGLVVWGDVRGHWLFWVGVGIIAYGLLYFTLHDVIVHQRLRFRYRFRHPYLLRVIRAHKIHHKNLGREGGEAFGFLYAAPRYAPRKEGDVDRR